MFRIKMHQNNIKSIYKESTCKMIEFLFKYDKYVSAYNTSVISNNFYNQIFNFISLWKNSNYVKYNEWLFALF